MKLFYILFFEAAPFSTGIAGGELKYEFARMGTNPACYGFLIVKGFIEAQGSVCGPSQFCRLASSIRSYPDGSLFGTWRPCRCFLTRRIQESSLNERHLIYIGPIEPMEDSISTGLQLNGHGTDTSTVRKLNINMLLIAGHSVSAISIPDPRQISSVSPSQCLLPRLTRIRRAHVLLWAMCELAQLRYRRLHCSYQFLHQKPHGRYPDRQRVCG